jgi:mono/diheme cytochrome c family protein
MISACHSCRPFAAFGAIVLTSVTFIGFAAMANSLPTAAQLDRGRYLLKTAGCNDCHTQGYMETAGRVPESRWLTGNSLGWQGPWGTTYAVNLRLFVQNLTPEQWRQIARQPARPPMPWFALRDMTDEDLTAIYQFIRSLGPAGTQAPGYAQPGTEVQTPVVRFPPPREAKHRDSDARSGGGESPTRS